MTMMKLKNTVLIFLDGLNKVFFFLTQQYDIKSNWDQELRAKNPNFKLKLPFSEQFLKYA